MTVKVNNKTNEIFIYDVIGADWFGGGITAKGVIDALDQLGGKRATVRINSPGGVADEGIAIYNALKRYDGGVDTYVDALAASAASVIALAGQNRYTAKGARWMIHQAIGVAMGNASELAKMISVLEKYDESLVEIYSDYMDDSADIMELLKAETWYTASEAIKAGLSTATSDDVQDAEPVAATWFRHAPAAISNRDKKSPRLQRNFFIASRM